MLVTVGRPAFAADPWADHVESYLPGASASAPYTNPQAALGEPARFTDHELFPSVVSLLSPPFLGSQIVQLAEGGSLTVRFDEPVTDHPAHPFGADLIVFSNNFFVGSYPDGTLSNPAQLYVDGTGRLEVSADGVNFFEVPGALESGLFPTQGYLDAAPFAETPGQVPTDFRVPVNPALKVSDFSGLTFAQALALYAGSGGGAPVDISLAVAAGGQPAGLTQVSYVRISNLSATPLEIDAFASVPEPLTLVLLWPASLAVGRRNRPRDLKGRQLRFAAMQGRG
ncbi:MAG: hypothetical protein HRF43_19170 [Phycisphaerae bacterium]